MTAASKRPRRTRGQNQGRTRITHAAPANGAHAAPANGAHALQHGQGSRFAVSVSNRTPALADHEPRLSFVHRAALALVFVTMMLCSIVLREPAPFELFMMALIVLLPVVGLVRFSPAVLSYATVWIVISACGFFAAIFSQEPGTAAKHVAISLYLALASTVIAGFVLENPQRHVRLIVNGLIAAAVIAALLALAGYTSAFPGAYELFTNYGRARGPFKDPNVFGAFLSSIIVLAGYRIVQRDAGIPLFATGFCALIMLAILLSFSRSAWAATIGCLVFFLGLSFITSRSTRQRLRLFLFGFFGAIAVCIVLAGALQFSAVTELLSERANLSLSYDQGPEGRFGGQLKAIQLILENPFGLGAQEFSPRYHDEEPHNVYLVMFLNAGWIGGGLFLALTLATIVAGFRYVAMRSPLQTLYIALYSAYLATALGGLLIDTDHWRHLYILMGALWGMIFAKREHEQRRRVGVALPPDTAGVRRTRPSRAPLARCVPAYA